MSALLHHSIIPILQYSRVPSSPKSHCHFSHDLIRNWLTPIQPSHDAFQGTAIVSRPYFVSKAVKHLPQSFAAQLPHFALWIDLHADHVSDAQA
jgi:hypothetical protein